jgi:hypothetical protein
VIKQEQGFRLAVWRRECVQLLSQPLPDVEGYCGEAHVAARAVAHCCARVKQDSSLAKALLYLRSFRSEAKLQRHMERAVRSCAPCRHDARCSGAMAHTQELLGALRTAGGNDGADSFPSGTEASAIVSEPLEPTVTPTSTDGVDDSGAVPSRTAFAQARGVIDQGDEMRARAVFATAIREAAHARAFGVLVSVHEDANLTLEFVLGLAKSNTYCHGPAQHELAAVLFRRRAWLQAGGRWMMALAEYCAISGRMKRHPRTLPGDDAILALLFVESADQPRSEVPLIPPYHQAIGHIHATVPT